MKKLLFFTSDYKIGQSCLLTDQLFALSRSDLSILAISGENEQENGLKAKTIKNGIDIQYINGLDEHSNFLRLAKIIADIISRNEIRCIHVQNNWQMMLAIYAKFILLQQFGIKIIYTLHGFRNNSPIKSIVARIIIGLMLELFASKVICMSTFLKRKFSFLGKKMILLPLGISDEYFYEDCPTLPKNGLQMVFPAQFRKGKNQDLIIRAFAKHIKLCNDNVSHLYLPGSGNLFDGIKQLSYDLDIAQRVSLTGHITKEELLHLYLNCNIGIIASNSETFGQSIVEPFVLGRCVISTHVGIADDILTDGKNGYFFSSEDDLVNVLGKLYRNQELIENAGTLNFKNRHLFCWKHITKRYVELINSL